METENLAHKKRERDAKRRLVSEQPRCACCGMEDWRCLEAHHIAGRALDPTTIILCRNCHRVVSDLQKDHPQKIKSSTCLDECLAHFLMGMADMFEVIIKKLREFAMQLLARPTNIQGVQS